MSNLLIEQAVALSDRLSELRSEWRDWPVMNARLGKLIRMASWRKARRRRSKRALAEIRLLRELREDVARWAETGDARDLRYILDTLKDLDEQFPITEEENCERC